MVLDKKVAEQTINYLTQINAIKLNTKNPFTWTSGIKSPIYCDNRLLLSYPEIRKFIAEKMSEIIKNKYGENISITGAVIQIGNEKITSSNWNEGFINKNPFFSPNKSIIKIWEDLILLHRKRGSSLGAIIEVRVKNCPPGLGEPIYQKIDSEISKAILSINAVKGIEFGTGFNLIDLDGTNASDQISYRNQKIVFDSNHAGGILGGITSGQEIVFRYIVKPTSSVLSEKNTITKNFKNTKIKTIGRHDPCVGIRAVPVGIAMTSFVIADLMLMQKSKLI